MSHPDNSWQTWGFPSWIGKLPYGTGWITLDFPLIIHNQHNHAYDLTYDLNYNLGRVEGEAWSKDNSLCLIIELKCNACAETL